MQARSLTLPRFAAMFVALTVLSVLGTFAQSPAPGVPTQAPAMPGYPGVGAPPVLTLLAPGSVPRTQLRYAIRPDQRDQIDVTTRMSRAGITRVGGVVSQDMQDMFTIPTIQLTAEVRVTSVVPDGDITYDLWVTGMTLEASAGADPKVAQSWQPLVALMTPTKGSATASSRGVTKSTRLDVANPALRLMLGQVISAIGELAIPFPDVAVGVGARWEVRQALVFEGLTAFSPTAFRKTEYELVSIDGSTVSLKVKTEQTAPPQSLSNPPGPISNQGIVFGAENRLQKMSGSGTGTVVVHLDSLVPVSTRESRTSMAVTISMNEQTASLTVDGEDTITIAPPGMAPTSGKTLDLKTLRGITAVNLGGTSTSTVGPDRLCYPRAANAGASIAMGGFLKAAMEALEAGGIKPSPRSTDFLTIDAQIHDAAQCKASITLELRRGLGQPITTTLPNGKSSVGYGRSPVVWRRVFEVEGAPAGFSTRVIERLKIEVADFVSAIAQARK